MNDSGSGVEEISSSLEGRMGRSRQKPRVQQPRKLLPWLIIAGIVTAVWSFLAPLGVTPPQNADFDTSAGIGFLEGYLVGGVIARTLAIAALVNLGLYLVAGRRLTPGCGLRHFVILLIVAVLAALPFTIVALTALHGGAAARDQTETIMADYRVRSAEVAVRHDLSRRTSVAHATLTAPAIAAPGGVQRARQAVAELKALQEATETDLIALLEATSADLRAVPASEAHKTSLERELQSGRTIAERSFALSRRAVELQSRQVELLARQPRAWEVRDGAFAFYRQGDLAAYNGLVGELAAIQTEMEALQAAGAADREVPGPNGQR